MGLRRSLVQKIFYKRRKFVTKKRLKQAVNVAAELFPALVARRPGLAAFQGVLDALTSKADEPELSAPVSAAPTANGKLRRRIKALKAEIATVQDAEQSAKMQVQLDVLHDLLLDESEES